MNRPNKVLRFQSPRPKELDEPTAQSLPSKLHPKVKRRRFIWLALMVMFLGWCGTQLVIQELKIHDKEQLLHERQQELKQSAATTKQLSKELQRFSDEDYMLEQAHKHGYGKPGEKIMPVDE